MARMEYIRLNGETVRDSMKRQNLVKEIEVNGDSSYYYPVTVKPIKTENYRAIRVGLGKFLETKTANYSGNHPSGTSSCSYEWIMSAGGWDGNERFLRLFYGMYTYAPLLSHIEMQGGCYSGIVLWIRGGGISYKISCDDLFSVNIYYEQTNLGYGDYPYYVSPRTDIGNGGAGNVGTMTVEGIIK